jgi:hypothetical protein
MKCRNGCLHPVYFCTKFINRRTTRPHLFSPVSAGFRGNPLPARAHFSTDPTKARGIRPAGWNTLSGQDMHPQYGEDQ